MDNTFVLRKRIFAIVTTAAMVLGSVSAALVPQTASAASGGDLIKGTSLSTVYYYGYDGSRYTFPNEKTYMTWRADFDDVETISDSALADISLAGNVVYRPGAYWVKITSDAKTYAVSTDGMIHWIESEDVAIDYAGSDWNTRIHDVPDVFFVDYTTGASLETAMAFDGMAYMDGGEYYLAWGGDKRMVNEMADNHLWSWMFLDGEGIDDSALSDGSDINGAECVLFDIAQTGGCEDESTATGDLEVSVASDTPAAMSIPNSAARVEVASFDFEAGSTAAELNSLTVSLGGLSTTDALGSDGVYLYEGDSRLTEGRTVNSSTREATFAGLNLAFEANETRTISVVVDMSTTASSGSFYFYIANEEDVDTDGDVDGDFPLEGETHSITDIDVGSVSIVKTGSIANPTLGESDATVGKFQLQVGSGEDISVHTITLKVDQSSDHSDYKIWQGSDQVGTGEYIGNKLVLFTFDEAYEIEKSKNVNFSVSADIGGQAADTVEIYLNSDADLNATGDDYGFNVTVNRAAYDGGADPAVEASGTCAGTSSDCSFSTIQGGDITFAFAGPSAGDVKIGAEDYTFLAFSVTSINWAEVDSMTVLLSMTEADAADDSTFEEDPLTDIKLVMSEDGSLVAGPQELTATANGADTDTITFTDNWVLEAGVTYDMAITADVETTADAADTYTFTIDMSALAVEDANNDAIATSSIVPSSDIAGYAHTVQAASLTVTLASTPTGDTTYVRGSQNVDVVAYNFTAGQGSDVELTDLTVEVWVDHNSAGGFAIGQESTTIASDRISSCSLIDSNDESLIDGPRSITSAAAGTILFQNFSWTIEAGNTNKAFVRCNLANVDPGDADEFSWQIDGAGDGQAVSGDITALDDEGTSIAAASITATGINASETTKISVVTSGSLAIAVDSSTPSADFVITGSSNNEVSVFEFSATNEDFEITTFTVAEQQAKQDDADADGAVDDEDTSYTNNISLVTIEYPKADGTMGTKTSSMTGNEAKFTMAAGTGIYVESGEDAQVTVYVNVPASDRNTGGSATSNEKIMLDYFRDTTNDDNFKAIGQGSGTTLDDDDVGATSTDPSTFVVRETVPTVTLHASSPSGGGKVPGDQEVYRFTVAANDNEDVVLNNMIWKLASTDNGSSNWNQCDTDLSGANAQTAHATSVDTTDFDIYNLSKEGTSTALDANADWTVLKADGTSCNADAADVGFIKLALTTAEIVPAGSSYTYALYMDTTAASAVNDDSIQLTLTSDPIVTTYLTGSDLNEANLSSTDTTLTVTTSGPYRVGDVLCMDTADDGCGSTDEKMLLTAIPNGTTLTVIRGYLGTEPNPCNTAGAVGSCGNDAGDDIDFLPGAFRWQDDGSNTSSVAGEYWGAYLVDNLPLTGNAISF